MDIDLDSLHSDRVPDKSKILDWLNAKDLIEPLISELPRREARVVKSHIFEFLSFDELARIYRTNPTRIRCLWGKALKRMRRLVIGNIVSRKTARRTDIIKRRAIELAKRFVLTQLEAEVFRSGELVLVPFYLRTTGQNGIDSLFGLGGLKAESFPIGREIFYADRKIERRMIIETARKLGEELANTFGIPFNFNIN